jgi:hypothetical protein
MMIDRLLRLLCPTGVLVVLLFTACVPTLQADAQAELSLLDSELRFETEQDLEEVVIYLEGDDLRLDDDRCANGSGAWECRFEDVDDDKKLYLALSGELTAAAAVWGPPTDGRPYPLVSRAYIENDTPDPPLPLPSRLKAMAPEREDHPWAGDPEFDPEELPEAAARWYGELMKLIEEGEMRADASSGNLYQIGRYTNLDVTALLLAFAKTGDLRLLDGIDEAMQLARDELRDEWRNGSEDDYLGWLYLRNSKDESRYYGKDNIELDDMMAHGMVAAVTYAYYLNRFNESPSGVDYNERFQFWIDYLLNHYEAKWRERNDVRKGFPFVRKGLIHPTVGMVRYLHYMGLMGYERHARAAADLAEELADHFKLVETAGGDAYVYDHGFGGERYGMPPTTYARYTMPVMLELAITGLEPFGVELVEPFANTIAFLMLGDEPFSTKGLLAADIGGGERAGGVRASEFVDEDERYDSNRFPALTPFGRFDDSGRIFEVVERIGDKITSDRLVLAAGMVYALDN